MRSNSAIRVALGTLSLGLITAMVCLANLGGYRPLTTHEVLVARTAKEMWRRGEWIVPTFLGEPRLRKPPLAYWETMLAYQWSGAPTEWSARLPSALAGVALVLVVYWFVAGALRRSTAWLAGFLLATSTFFLTQARLAEADMTLCAAVAGALASFGRLARVTCDSQQRPSRWLVGVFWLCACLAVLAKGPVGLLFIGGTVALFRLLGPGHGAVRALWAPKIIAASLAATAIWPIAVVLAEPSAARIWWSETWDRFLADPNGVRRYPFYYAVAALALTLPWTPLWLAYLWTTRRRWRGAVLRIARPAMKHARPRKTAAGTLDRLLAAWLMAPLVLLSLAGGKQQHYLMPALVPCAVWAARYGQVLRRRWSAWWLRTFTAGRSRSLGSSLLHPRALVPACLAAILIFQFVLLPLIHGRRATARWIQQVQSNVSRENPVVVLGHSVQWIGFYLERDAIGVPTLEAYFARPAAPAEWVLATRRELPAIQARRAVGRVLESPAERSLAEDRRAVLVEVHPLVASPPGATHAN